VQQSDLTVWADRDRLVQAVINLLANAIKFSPESSVISINVEESHGLVRLSIMDRGRGMPEEFQKRLFSRFSQALASDAADQKGFGLGLSITKQIIDQHKAEISLTSKLGEGTTFTISLHQEPTSGNQDIVPPSPSSSPPLKRSAWLATGTSLRQKGLLLVGLPLLFQILFAGTLSTLLWHSYERVSAAAHARQVASQCTITLRKTDDLFLAAFSVALNGQSGITNSYADTKKRLRSSLVQLIALADSDELPAARKIEHTTSMISDRLDKIFRSNRLSLPDIISGAQKDNLHEIDLMMDDVQDALTQLKNHEKNFEAKDPIARQTIRQQILWLLLIGFAANVSMALLLLHYLSTSISKRLTNILENANRLLRRVAMLSPEEGTDEIAELDRTFYKTAERLFSLEQFKDELLSVVGHDLRTPICSLQGYLLMVTNGLVGTLPAALLDEVTATEAEAERLVGFINDLLTAEKMKTSRGEPL
jgi:signal transduction histidine kinase